MFQVRRNKKARESGLGEVIIRSYPELRRLERVRDSALVGKSETYRWNPEDAQLVHRGRT